MGRFNIVCQKLSRATPGSPLASTGDREEKLEEGAGAWLLLGQENEGRRGSKWLPVGNSRNI